MDGMQLESLRTRGLPNNCSANVLGNGQFYHGDMLEILPKLAKNHFQCIIADPPYFQVLLKENWDNIWQTPNDYLTWSEKWVTECRRVLKSDGLIYIFGQLGKREHVWLEFCARITKIMQFHDMIIWDRAVGYNDRKDSFTPQYEMILVLRHFECDQPYFDKNAVREPYDEATINLYLRDKRYKDRAAREDHLRQGKYATNIMRIPSLKGSSREKIGHPSQKPIELITRLIKASTRPGEIVLDPFLGSGTTAEAAERLGRSWVGIEKNENYIDMVRQRLLMPIP